MHALVTPPVRKQLECTCPLSSQSGKIIQSTAKNWCTPIASWFHPSHCCKHLCSLFTSHVRKWWRRLLLGHLQPWFQQFHPKQCCEGRHFPNASPKWWHTTSLHHVPSFYYSVRRFSTPLCHCVYSGVKSYSALLGLLPGKCIQQQFPNLAWSWCTSFMLNSFSQLLRVLPSWIVRDLAESKMTVPRKSLEAEAAWDTPQHSCVFPAAWHTDCESLAHRTSK